MAYLLHITSKYSCSLLINTHTALINQNPTFSFQIKRGHQICRQFHGQDLEQCFSKCLQASESQNACENSGYRAPPVSF